MSTPIQVLDEHVAYGSRYSKVRENNIVSFSFVELVGLVGGVFLVNLMVYLAIFSNL